MRVADRPFPAYAVNDLDDALVDWPMSLHVVIEGNTPALLWDGLGLMWDDPRALWDALQLTGDMVDLSCNMAGAEIIHGPPDDLHLYPSGTLTLTLVDPDGRYTRYNPDGTLSQRQLGKRLGVIVNTNGTHGFAPDEHCWLFFGRVTSWDDIGEDMVEVSAHNVVNDMTTRGDAYTPGSAGQKPNARLSALMDAATVVGKLGRFDVGTVNLTAQPTTQSPWEESQTVAMSDGGIVFADADDAVVYFDRDYHGTGRADQTRFHSFTDNACDLAEVVVWNPELSTNDETLATQVKLANVAALKASAVLTPNPYNTMSTLTHPNPDQWTTQAEGDALAAALLATHSVPMMQPASFQLMVDDPRFPELWPIAVDTRIGDRIVFVHNYRPDGMLMVGGIINHVAHSITPAQWVTTLAAWSYTLPVGTVGVAGTPGHWLDATGLPARPPATFSDLGTVTAQPVTFPLGQYVVLGDGTEVWHNVAGWHIGRTPEPAPAQWHRGRWQSSTWSPPNGGRWTEDNWGQTAWAVEVVYDAEVEVVYDGAEVYG